MEFTARPKERFYKKYNQLDKNGYYQATPFRRYVPFFQHVYYYTRKVPVKTGRPNKKKPDIHIIYSLFMCKWMFNLKDYGGDDNKYKLTNSDLIMIWGLAFDNESKFFRDWKLLHKNKPLVGVLPTAYRMFFRKDDVDLKKKKRYLNNNKFDDYYSQINKEDFFSIVRKLLKKYEDYRHDNDNFKTNMDLNKGRSAFFLRHYDFVKRHITELINKVSKKSRGSVNDILEDFNNHRYSHGWDMFYELFSDKIDTSFLYPKKTFSKNITLERVKKNREKYKKRNNN